MIDYRIYLVTDDPSRYSCDWLENVRAAVEGGVTCVQYRDTENEPRVQYERILRLRDALSAFKTPIIVNNDAELAKSVKAEGVHVGQNDMPVAEVRNIVGPACEIGLSITHISQLSSLIPHPPSLLPPPSSLIPDSLGIGPVFDARKTKADASEAMGTEGLAEIVSVLTRQECRVPFGRASDRALPLVAIGGITLENAARVLAAGATGLAVVSAFSKSHDACATARSFRGLFR